MMQTKEHIPGNVCTVLLLDDNPIQAATRQAILKRAGYYAITALNPVRALEQFRNDDFPGSISLVVTDHIMPAMTGSQFVRELRRIQPDMPVIVVSGLLEAEDEYDDLNVRFLVKPIPPESLISNVRNLLLQQHEGAA